jgi:hypothetical protein
MEIEMASRMYYMPLARSLRETSRLRNKETILPHKVACICHVQLGHPAGHQPSSSRRIVVEGNREIQLHRDLRPVVLICCVGLLDGTRHDRTKATQGSCFESSLDEESKPTTSS